MSLANVQFFPSLSQSYQPDLAVLTIEEIRLQLYSCFTCGVCWLEDHVCLDCAECGGYSLQRPCLSCDGLCGASWKRDLTMSNASGKSRWIGTCQLQNSVVQKSLNKLDESHNQRESLQPRSTRKQ